VILKQGEVDFDGPTTKATAQYYTGLISMGSDSDLSARQRQGNGKARFTSITIQPLDSIGRPLDAARPGCDLSIDVAVECKSNLAHANLAIIIFDSNGYRVVDTNTAQKGEFISMQAGQVARANFRLREVLLKPGGYLVGLWLGREAMEIIDYIEHATHLDIIDSEEVHHVIVFPGVYLCRFENSVTIS
jgi:hypothetical protein